MFQLRAAVASRLSPAQRAQKPRDTRVEIDGFSATFAEPFDITLVSTLVFVGLGLSTAGMAVILASSAFVAPGAFTPEGGFAPTYLLLALLTHAFLQLVPLLLIVPSRMRQSHVRTRQTVGLTGRLLRVGDQSVTLSGRTEVDVQFDQRRARFTDGGTSVTVHGSASELAWLAEQIAAVSDGGDADSVPAALRQLEGQ